MHQTKDYIYSNKFELESGGYLPGFRLRYTTYGSLNSEQTNVIWVCHALTANANFLDWWHGLFGPGHLYNPDDYFIICANALGSCYGSTGPLSTNPKNGSPYYHNFPQLTNRDMVRAFDLLRQHLQIKQLHTLLGGSLGGQHALEWAIMHPDCVRHLVQLCSNAQHSPWGIAFNESQRMAIANDPSWDNHHPEAGLQGLKTARSIALLSYRHYRTYQISQAESNTELTNGYRASSYQQYQGEKLAKRFNAFSYWVLSKAMDSHHIGRARGTVAEVLGQIKANALFLGISTDLLFPASEQEFMAKHVPNAHLSIVESDYGHDGFLIEIARLENELRSFYQKTGSNTEVTTSP